MISVVFIFSFKCSLILPNDSLFVKLENQLWAFRFCLFCRNEFGNFTLFPKNIMKIDKKNRNSPFHQEFQRLFDAFFGVAFLVGEIRCSENSFWSQSAWKSLFRPLFILFFLFSFIFFPLFYDLRTNEILNWLPRVIVSK